MFKVEMTFKYDCTGSFGRDKPKRLGKNIIRNFIFLKSGFVWFYRPYLYVSSIYFIDSKVVIRKPQAINPSFDLWVLDDIEFSL